MATTFAITLGLLGLALLTFGIRGRRTGDAPHCRDCNFDVTGVATTCPECGRDLTKPRATTRGARRHRPIVATMGALLLMTGIAAALVAASGIDLNPHKPTWWLARFDARRLPGPELDAAMTELAARVAVGSPSKEAVRPAIAAALERQADRSIPWSPTLGDVFEAAWAAGWVDEQERLRYLRQSLKLELWVLDPHTAGEIHIGLGSQHDRFATIPDPAIAAPIQILPVTAEIIDSTGAAMPTLPQRWGLVESGARDHGSKVSGGALAQGLPPGEYTIRTTWTVRIDPGIDNTLYGAGGWSTVFNADLPQARDPNAAFIEWEETLTGTATVLAEDIKAFELVSDETMAATIRAAIGTQRLKYQRSGDSMIWIGGTLEINFDDLPVALDHYLVVRQGEREWKLNKSQRVTGGKRPWTHYANPQYPSFHIFPSEIDTEKPFDLLLRADPRVAWWADAFRRTGAPVPIFAGDIPLVEGALAE